MTIRLTEYERGQSLDDDAAAAIADLQAHLGRLQLSQTAHGGRAIILVDGWEGAGKRDFLRLLAGSLDPCRVSTNCSADLDGEDGRHWLAPYWSRVPRSGHTAMFLRGWYGALVDARTANALGDRDWSRSFDEINEFEAQQTDHGTIVVKIFFHVAESVQAIRLRDRSEDPWQRWTLTAQSARSLESRAAYQENWESMFKRSHTRWAGWTVIDAGDEMAGQVAAMTAVAAALEKGLPAEPPEVGNSLQLSDGNGR